SDARGGPCDFGVRRVQEQPAVSGRDAHSDRLPFARSCGVQPPGVRLRGSVRNRRSADPLSVAVMRTQMVTNAIKKFPSDSRTCLRRRFPAVRHESRLILFTPFLMILGLIALNATPAMAVGLVNGCGVFAGT